MTSPGDSFGRTPQGVRGLKLVGLLDVAIVHCRTPQGVRGLKQQNDRHQMAFFLSHSARSAWIETGRSCLPRPQALVALRKECVD